MINAQSRNEIKYEWLVEYPDGTTLPQFDDVKQEAYHFGHIDLPRVSKFHLISKDSQSKYTVDLVNGCFYHNGMILNDIVNANTEISHKLIYFRRVKRTFTPGSPVQTVEMIYFMGWEAKTESGKIQHIIEIDEAGNYKIPVDELNTSGFSQL